MAELTRIKKVQKLLTATRLEAIVIDLPLDLLYLTHLKLSLGRLVIDQKSASLFVDGRYIEAAEKNAPCSVILTQGYGPQTPFGTWAAKKKYKKVAFDSTHTSHEQFLELKKHFSLFPLPAPIKELRQIKTPDEIAKLKQAAVLGKKGYEFVKGSLKEGVSELELAADLEIFWLKNGGEGLSFTPIIAFGENGSQPHYRSSTRKLKKGDSVLIDIGVMKNGYASDLTRVVFFGKPHPEIKKIYKIVDEARSKAFDLCKPGVRMGDLDQAARAHIEKKGYGKYFNHSLGHGVGMEVHEFPIVRNVEPYSEYTAVPGMVFTVEPGIYLPGIGGVRLEDTLVITKNGHEIL